MAKNKGGTPTERAAAADKARKSAAGRLKAANAKLADLKAASAKKLRAVRTALASQGAKRIGTAAAGGALAGAGHAVLSHFAEQGTFGDTVGEYLTDRRISGAVTAALGAGVVLLGEKKGGKNKAMIADVGAGMVAGGIAIAADPVVRGLLPAATNGVRPRGVGALRVQAQPPVRRVLSADQVMRLSNQMPRLAAPAVGQLRPMGQQHATAANANGFR